MTRSIRLESRTRSNVTSVAGDFANKLKALHQATLHLLELPPKKRLRLLSSGPAAGLPVKLTKALV